MTDLSGGVPVSGSDVGSALLPLTAMAAAVTAQPTFPAVTAKELQDLNSHLTTAKGHARAWTDNWNQQVMDRLQGLVSFGETFLNLQDGLLAAAKAMGDEKQFAPNEIAKLVDALQALQTLVREQRQKGEAVFGDLTTYSKDVSDDYSTFLTDFQTANHVLGGDTGEIARLSDKIRAENDAMSKDLAMIGGGSAMMVVGILVIAVGALLEFETAGTATLVIAAGVGIVAGGAAMTGVAGKDYDDKMAQVSQDEAQLASDRKEIALLHGVNAQLETLTSTLAKAQAALGNLVTAWEQLDNGVGAVVTDLQNPEDYLATVRTTHPDATPATVAMIIAAEIETAGQDWDNAVKLATGFLAKARTIQYVDTGSSAPTQDQIVKAAVASGHPVAQPRVRTVLAAS